MINHAPTEERFLPSVEMTIRMLRSGFISLVSITKAIFASATSSVSPYISTDMLGSTSSFRRKSCFFMTKPTYETTSSNFNFIKKLLVIAAGSFLFSYYLWGNNFDAKFGMIDDYEIMYLAGSGGESKGFG
ncbi:MAG: hypothetical protein ABII25_05500, partial [bacterium]